MALKLTDALHIHIDLETYSEANLKDVGVDAYSLHPSTDVLLADYAIGDGPVRGWRPGYKYPFAKYHDRLGENVFFLCWNSRFERIMWWNVMCKRYDWPEAPLEAFICVAAWARSTAASPGELDKASRFFDVAVKKDMAGHRLMLQMCRPATEKQQLDWTKENPEREFDHHPDDFAAVRNYLEAQKRCHHTPDNIDKLDMYCRKDVGAERGIAELLPEWEWPEIDAFWEGERINDRGLCVDVEFARAATAYADDEKAEFNERLFEITDGVVEKTTQTQRLLKWALPGMSDEAVKMTEWYDKGIKKNTLDADTRANLLLAADGVPDFLDDDVHEAIEIMDAASKSTIAKYTSIANRAIDVEGNDRVCGSYMFAGAAQSGRYSSKGTQLHNLLRDVPKEAPDLIEAFIGGEVKTVERQVRQWAASQNERKGKDERKTPASPIHCLGSLIRPTIWAPIHPVTGAEKWLVWGDWSAFEARILPWLAVDPDADDLLALFRRGEDIYLKVASDVTGRRITEADKFERQAFGKVPQLSLGYGGGEGAFKAMAKNYGVHLDDTTVRRVVKDWRAANPWAKRFWDALEKAAMTALERPGVGFSAGRIEYLYEPDDLGGMGCLYAILPSGRRVPYPDPDVEVQEKSWGDVLTVTCRKGAWSPAKDAKDWPRVGLWKGLLAENCIAYGTEVLTKQGWVAIQHVADHDCLWDGEKWVAHDGLVWQGYRKCLNTYGIWTTPEHEILTTEGWLSAAEAQRNRHDRQEVRLPYSAVSGPYARQSSVVDVPLRMRQRKSAERQRSAAGQDEIVRLHARRVAGTNPRHARHEQTSGLRRLAFHARSLPPAIASGLAQLRRAWNQGMQTLAGFFGILGGHGADLQAGAYAGPSSERLRLHTRQLSLGNIAHARQQQAHKPSSHDASRRNDRITSQPRFRREAEHDTVQAGERLAGQESRYRTAVLRKFAVYDLKNAGPLRRFTVRGTDGPVIVHNCTQAAQADFLNEALVRAPAKPWGLEVAGHTHDEIVCESGDPERDARRLLDLMETSPDWPGVDALPVKAEVEFGRRYKVSLG